MEPLPGVPQPVGRRDHGACCLNYGEDNPKVLMSGGLDNGVNVLGDMWILDVNSGKWTEVRMLVYSYSSSVTSIVIWVNDIHDSYV